MTSVGDTLDEEMLLVDRLGIARMGILISRGFEKADRRKTAGRKDGEEILEVLLMIGRAPASWYAG